MTCSHTYGITSDPLTQLACVFSALIHDVGKTNAQAQIPQSCPHEKVCSPYSLIRALHVDHEGVPNATLVEESHPVASKYEGRSVAEQNSVDLAWNLLMEDKYKDLRSTIYSTSVERKRFRQLIVNSVMATDILDAELKSLRNNRWERAFSEQSIYSASALDESSYLTINRKATVVIEHLIQVSSNLSSIVFVQRCNGSHSMLLHCRAGF